MAAESRREAPSRLLLLVQNQAGYLNLCELLSRAWIAQRAARAGLVEWEWLAELRGGLDRAVGRRRAARSARPCSAGDDARAAALAERLGALFPRRFYIELQRAGLPSNEAHVRAAVPLAARSRLPVVATHPVQFLRADDFEAHEARVCVADGEMLANPRRVKRFSREQYFKTQAQMEALFADLPSALANTVEIAQALQPRAGARQAAAARLPDADQRRHAAADGRVLPHRLARRARAAPGAALSRCRGARARAPALRRAARLRDRDDPEDGLPRLLPDRRRLHQLGARSNGCPVGPGRGSGAGSLVAYALNITDLDPLQYNLLFERFLNPERVSMPDFDIDFCQGNRDRVIDYVKAEVRPRRGEPDRDLRHDGGEGRAARRRPRARHGLRPRRLDRQADPGAAGQDGDAGEGAREARPRRDLRAQGSARARAARSGRGRGRRAAGAGRRASRASCATSACTPAAC